MALKSFASDNNSGVHPKIIEALNQANNGHAVGYGDDPITKKAVEKLKQLFKSDVDVYFVFTGTAANVLSIATICKPYHAVICADTSHLHVDECGAPERFTGCKLITVPSSDGKLHVDLIKPYLEGFDFEHHVQPLLISVTQSTELGTVYAPGEIKEIARLAHENNMYLHIDGARIANALVSLDCTINEITSDVGVDVVSFGGTKNGMMFGESVIFFNKNLSQEFKYIRKQGMHLYSKMRFASAQFVAYLENDLWLKNAAHSNKMAKLLEKEINKIPQIKITRPVESNGVFAIVPETIIEPLREKYFFYTWDEHTSEVRWMCSFDTTEEDIMDFVAAIKNLL
jgi:threonine aldolase